ncbi:MAG TPA: c-type cytochrome biogenesis protein CcmI [Alphaproteobacteria bacterium]|nr:c-type cytochrome biogenesis protein CcmI [Alphaproteobacteria bacterium]
MPITFWIIAAFMSLGAVALTLFPLLRRQGAGQRRDAHALQVYRAQLAEVAADHARGLISAENATAAEIEIKRRMLAVADAAPDADQAQVEPASAPGALRRWGLAALLLFLMPGAAFAIYANVGSPRLAPASAVAQVRGADEEHMDMSALVGQLAGRLEQNPEDLSGWMLLGRSYSSMGDFNAAVGAYEKAVNLLDGRSAPMVLAEYAEALVFAAEGEITPAASAQFKRVREIMPSEPRARFYLGVERAQSGDLRGALNDWVALVNEAEPDASWVGAGRRQIDEAARILQLDVAALLKNPQPAAAAGASSGQVAQSTQPPMMAPGARVAGPTAEDMAAAAQMSEGDRNTMIEGMVAQLAERLENEEPDNTQGWLRLARAYNVLGRTDEALAAYERAAATAPDDLDVLGGYAEALQAAGEAEPVSDRFAGLLKKIVAIAPDHRQALWFLGVHAAQAGDNAQARAYWTRLRDLLPAGSIESQAISRSIAGLE